MTVGTIIASHRVMRDGARVGYLYREPPDSSLDSGWRVFSGDESEAYVDDADNFAIYNASTILEHAPELAERPSPDRDQTRARTR